MDHPTPIERVAFSSLVDVGNELFPRISLFRSDVDGERELWGLGFELLSEEASIRAFLYASRGRHAATGSRSNECPVVLTTVV